MSDDLDFDMEVVGDDDLDELGSDDASSLNDERRPVEAQPGETTAESTDPRRKRVENNRSGSSSPESDLDDVESSPSEVDPFRFGDVPADWSVSLVGEIAKGEKGLVDGDWVESKDMDEDGDIQLVQLGHIGEGQFKGQPNRFVNKEFAKEEDCTILSEGDLLISRMQEPILRSCLLPDFECDSIMAVDIARLRGNDDWNRIFLKYLFNSRPIWKQGIAWASGTTRKRISRKNIEKIRLQKPPLPEQRKIASVLYAVDQVIQKTEAIIEQAKRVKRGLMQDLFSGGYFEHEATRQVRVGPLQNKIPEGWGVKPLDDVTKKVTEIDHKMPEKQEEGVPFLAAGDIVNSYKIDLGEVERISEKDYDRLSEKFDPERGDVLYTRFGTIGHARRVDFEDEFIASYSVALIKPNDRVNSGFLEHFLNSTFARKEAYNRTRGSANRNLNLGEIKKLSVFLPPKSEQAEITRVLDEINELETSHEKKMRQMKRLKKSLMQDLLTGEVRTVDKAIEVLGEVKAHG